VVIGCCMPLRKADIPDHFEFKQRFYQHVGEWINRGDSAIVGPGGNFLAGPLQEAEGILYAEVDPSQLRGAKYMLDVAGHYARPDVFQLTVRREPRPLLRVHQEDGTAPNDAAQREGTKGTLESGAETTF
jgi:nitrilase